MKRNVIWGIVAYLRPVLHYQVLLLFLIVAGSATTLIFPFFLKIIIDQVFPHKDFVLLRKILLVLVGAYLLRACVFFCSRYLSVFIGSKIVTQIRRDLFKTLVRKPFTFFDDAKTGEIIYRIFNEVNFIQSAMTTSVIRFLNDIAVTLGLIATLSYLNFNLFISTILVYPIALGLSVFMSRFVKRSITALRESDAELLDHLTERFTKIRLIKIFASFVREERLLDSKMSAMNRTLLKNTLLSSFNQNVGAFILSLIPIVIFFNGGSDVLVGAMTLGSLIAFVQYAGKLYTPINDLLGLYSELIRMYVSFDRILEYLEIHDQRHADVPTEDVGRISTIEFDQVCHDFRGMNVFRSLNLYFDAGKIYGIIGRNGSGKSTIVNLLMKFYPVKSGRILINGIDLGTISNAVWMKKTTIVCHEEVFFQGSIVDNLQYGLDFVPPMNEVFRVLKIVELYDYLATLEYGLNTVVGESGIKLSTGQYQKLGIARALLRKPEVLILDEATSALDSNAESSLLARVTEELRGCIGIIISHRLSTLSHVSDLICIDQGEIVASGPPSLLRENNAFYNLFFLEQIKLINKENVSDFK